MSKPFKLAGKCDEIIDDIIEGLTFTAIAAKYGCGIATVFEFLNLSENQTRAREAVIMSAFKFEEAAEEAIREITDESSMSFVCRQKELAHHYRYRASKRNPNVFGDKIQMEQPADSHILPREQLLQIAERINSNSA